MLQLRGLGRIDQVKIGVNGRPMINMTVLDVGPLTPASTGAYTSGGEGPHGGGRSGTTIVVPTTAPASVKSPYGGPVWGPKSAPTVQPNFPVPPLPTFPDPGVSPPIATNPANPSEPAPSGTQVLVSGTPAWADKLRGKGGWIAAGVGLLAVGIAAFAGYHSHH